MSLVLCKIQFSAQKNQFYGSMVYIKGAIALFLTRPQVDKKIKLFSVFYSIFRTQKVGEKFVFSLPKLFNTLVWGLF